MARRVRSIAFLLILGSLPACSKAPTQEECRAGITRMMEIQIDELYAPGSAASSMIRAETTEVQRRMTAQFLKEGIPSLLTPKILADCVDRMKRSDLECTMSASSSAELVEKCHWKPSLGPKRTALSY